MTEFGYAGKILKIDLSSGKIDTLLTADYSDRFLGGRGIAAKLYWDMVPPQTEAMEPENCLICVTGPAAGFKGLAGCRWQICGKSPAMEPEAFSYANLGDRWGARLKYAGYDGVVVQGKADKPVYLFINNNKIEIRDASGLWGNTTFEAADALKAELGKGVSVLTIGPAAENLVNFSTILADDGSSGAGGLGSVMGSKQLKALVVAGDNRPLSANPERLETLVKRIAWLRKDTWKNWLWDVPGKTKLRPCYGCASGCFRKSYKAEGGRRFKYFCQPTDVYRIHAMEYSDDWEEVSLLAMRQCDRYGLDTMVMLPLINWLSACYEQGILEDDTGLPLSKVGSAEFIEKLTRMIGLREGFGDLLAQGMIKAADQLGQNANDLLKGMILTRGNEGNDYDPRLVLTNSILYATEQRRPINQVHELTHALWMWLKWANKEEDAFLSYDDFRVIAENFWGGAAAADFSTYEGKALAAKKIQDRAYAKESLILCDFLWPIIWVRFAEDHTGDPAMESRVLSAITGIDIDETELNKIGERIYNLQRAILVRQGCGGRTGDRLLEYLFETPLESVFFNLDCVVPGKDGKIISRKGESIDRDAFDKLMGEYYELRGWNMDNGLQTREKLEELQLRDVADDLKSRGLLG